MNSMKKEKNTVSCAGCGHIFNLKKKDKKCFSCNGIIIKEFITADNKKLINIKYV